MIWIFCGGGQEFVRFNRRHNGIQAAVGSQHADGIVRQELRDPQGHVKECKEGSGQKLFEYHNPPADPDEAMKKYPLEAPIELTAYPCYETFLGGGCCVGGGGSGAARINPQLQVIALVDGCLIMHQPAYNISGDSLFYGGGVRRTPPASHRWSPYTQVVFGGRRVSQEVGNPELRKELMEEWNNGAGTLGHDPMRSAWSVETSTNGPSLRVGGRVEVVITRPFAWRLINMEYSHSWMPIVYVQSAVPAADATLPSAARSTTQWPRPSSRSARNACENNIL